jgi:hypothetical protein
VGIKRLLERLGLHHLSVQGRARSDRINATGESLAIDVKQQFEAKLTGHEIAEGDHLPEFPGGVDMQQREWQRRRKEGLARQVEHDTGVLTD